MKAILINAQTKEISVVDIKTWKDIAPAIGCELFTTVRISETETLFVDDEGLLTLTDESVFFSFKGYNQPLAGNGLILGTDYEGESVDTTFTVDEVSELVKFHSLADVQDMVELA